MGDPSQIHQRLAYESPQDMLFGTARAPVSCGRGVIIGNGAVIPEVNFTLPPMSISVSSLPDVREQFRDMVTRILKRAVALEQPAIVLEFEHLFELTLNPDWGAFITDDIRVLLDSFHQKHGLRSALRVTVADVREQERPPRMRTGDHLQTMLRAFEACAQAGADILSIESTGGKELSDQALLEGDLNGITYALGVLAPRDMAFLWHEIVAIARRAGVVAGGDTACGFGNTAMQLAHQKMLPRVLAAVVRLMTAPRSLVAIEQGATGPLKDCGYENPILKAISGVPISMEGKSSACAHFSPLGNIAASVCDLWSNESVQNVRLLSGSAPEAFTEILTYDCRLMNQALLQGTGAMLRDLFEASDAYTDPQAVVLRLETVYEAARRIVEAGADPYARVVSMARLAVETIRETTAAGRLSLSRHEERWLACIETATASLPPDGATLRECLTPAQRALFLADEYGLTPS